MQHAANIDLDTVSALFEKGTYFDKVPAFHTLGHAVPGMEGEAIPYVLKDDFFVSAIVLFSFLLICYVLNKGHRLIIHQIKDFFVERTRGNLFVETGSEFRYQFFLISNTAILLGLILFTIFFRPEGTLQIIPSWQLLLFCIGACFILYVVKFLVYSLINWIFFEKAKQERWMEIYSLLVSLQGILLFPLACLTIYFNLSTRNGLIVLIFVLIIAKMLLFSKGMSIFFTKIQGLLCNILYFCTLEMIPLLLLLKIINDINQSWTLNI